MREAYSDAYLTAHFEVPGEMFSLAMAARRKDMGTVGSTQNILDFITDKVCCYCCCCILLSSYGGGGGGVKVSQYRSHQWHGKILCDKSPVSGW